MKLLTCIVGMGVLAVACGGSGELDADAGSDFDVTVGEAPTFDGCESSGDIVNYQWVIQAAPDDMAGDEGKVLRETMSDCSFALESAMIADEAGTWTIELTVTDGDGATSSDTVDVNVVP